MNVCEDIFNVMEFRYVTQRQNYTHSKIQWRKMKKEKTEKEVKNNITQIYIRSTFSLVKCCCVHYANNKS